MYPHKTHLRSPLSRNERFQLVLTAFDSASLRADTNQHADDVLEIATHLRATGRYHLLPSGLAGGCGTLAAIREQATLVISKRMRNSSHLGVGRSPPRSGL